jgi:hypothetical protein
MTTSRNKPPARVPDTLPDPSPDKPLKFPERIPGPTRQAICVALGQGKTQAAVAKEFDVSLSSVARIVRDTKKGFVRCYDGFDEIRALYRERPDFDQAIHDLLYNAGVTIPKGSLEWENLKLKLREVFDHPVNRRLSERLADVEVEELPGERTPQQQALHDLLEEVSAMRDK